MNIRCPNCKYEGKGKKFVRGSFFIEILLWVCFIIPGAIYTLWRLTSSYIGCPKCDYQYVIKL